MVFKRKEKSVTVVLVRSVARTHAVTLTAHSLLPHNAGTYFIVMYDIVYTRIRMLSVASN